MRRFMMAASASAIALSAPPLLITPAFAQALPTGCADALETGTPNNNNGQFDAGETIRCVSGSNIPQISTPVDDPTIVVGDATTPTAVVGIPGTHTHGIHLTNGGSITINNSASSVSGEDFGIEVTEGVAATDDITIVSQGAITSSNGVGINVLNDGTGAIDINVARVEGGTRGIRASNTNAASGNISVVTSDFAVGLGGAAVRVSNSSATGDTYLSIAGTSGGGNYFTDGTLADGISVNAAGRDLTINTTDTVFGSEDAIDAVHTGYGSATVSTGVVNAITGNGISVASSGSAIDISAMTGTILAGQDGVVANNTGSGATTVSVNNVNADASGVSVSSSASTTGDATVTANGTVTSGADGIEVSQSGSGDVTVTANDAVDAGGHGVDVYMYASATGDVSVTARGTIDADADGVSVNSHAASTIGAVNVEVYNVNAGTGGGDHGVYIRSTGSSVTVDAGGDVYATETITAGGLGVLVNNQGTGATTITVDAVNTGGDGVHVNAAATTTGDIDITGLATGTITSGADGIEVSQSGSGNVTVTANNAVYAGYDGVNVQNTGSGDVAVTVDQVNATARHGVFVTSNFATAADISVTANGAINAGGSGVNAVGGGAVSISVDAVIADNIGIIATTGPASTEDITVRADGAIESTSASGLQISNFGSGSVDIDVKAVDTGSFANSDGIFVEHRGDNLSIDAVGAVTAVRHGVNVRNDGTGATAINVDNITTTGGTGSHGVYVDQNSGSVTIDADGLIDAAGDGVLVHHDGAGTLDVAVEYIEAGQHGLNVTTQASSSGAINVTATKAITADGAGVIIGASGSSDVDVTVDSVTAYNRAVLVVSQPSSTGNVTVRANGTLTATNDEGVYLRRSGSGDTSLYVAGVTAGSAYNHDGVDIAHAGGALTVSSTGLISAGGRGVYVSHTGTGGSDITLHSVDAGGTGVEIYSGATTTGNVTVTASGTIDADDTGVHIYSNAASTTGAVNVDVHNVNAGTDNTDHGVYIRAAGSSVTVDAGGDVYATETITGGGRGVWVNNDGTGATTITVDTVHTAGDAIFADVAASATGAVTVEAQGSITSDSGSGVSVRNNGSGNTDITVNQVDATAGNGIVAVADSAVAGNLSVTANGAVNAGNFGLVVQGGGAVSVSVETVTANQRGLIVTSEATSAGNVTVAANDAITSTNNTGVYIRHGGSGSADVDVANVYAGSNSYSDGIHVTHAGYNLSIDAAGTITAGRHGVNVRNNGSGATTINVDNITTTAGAGSHGIYVDQNSGSVTIDADGLIDAAGHGVFVDHDGAGALDVTVDNVKSGETGIWVDEDVSSSSDIKIKAYGYINASSGVTVVANGAGNVEIDVDSINSTQRAVIVSSGPSSTGDLTVRAGATLTSTNNDGIFLQRQGAGDTSVYVDAVYAGTGAGDDGVYVRHLGGDLTIDIDGTVTAGGRGVFADHDGTGATDISVSAVNARYDALVVQAASSTIGDVDIEATGTITSTQARGVVVVNGYGSTDVRVVDVSGYTDGVFVHHHDINNAVGDLKFTSTGTITAGDDGVSAVQRNPGTTVIDVQNVYAGTDADDDGVIVNHSGTDLTIYSDGTITAGGDGVNASNRGTGATTIMVDTVHTVGDGVYVNHAGADLTIDIDGTVTAGSRGVFVDHDGTGATATDISVSAVNARYNALDVSVNADATGDVDIEATGTVTSTDGIGVQVTAHGSGAADIRVVDVSAATVGVRIHRASSGGDLEFTSTGTIAAGGNGVLATQNSSGATVINVQNVYAGTDADDIGVRTNHTGTDLTVYSDGTITAGGDGVDASNRGTGATDVTVDAVTAGARGVNVFTASRTTGDTNITATGHVSGYYAGVEVDQRGAGATTISVNTVYAEYGAGVSARTAAGGGALSITATGLISAYGADASDAGIGVNAYVEGDGVTVNAADIYGELYGVNIFNAGGGAVTVSAANVTGQYYQGVKVDSRNGTDVAVTTTGLVSGYGGVDIFNSGNGSTTVNVHDATGTYYDGVSVFQTTPHDVRVTSTGSVVGARDGIRVAHFGPADTFITAANVSGGYRGVYARSFSGGDIAIDADNVSGANIGIVASTTGGNIAVTSTGTVSSVNDAAIALFTDTVGRSDISVDAATVAGDVYGVFAFSANDGSLSIAADTISSAAGRGVYVYNLAGETDIAITSTGSVVGQLAGVDIANLGGGATTVQVNDVTASIGDGVNIVQATPHSISVTATGLVSGGDNGIEVLSVGGAEITISEGGSVTGAVAAIRLNGAAGDVVNLNSGGSIAGDVLLLDGDDTFTDASGQFTTVFGGDGTDTVNFEEGAARTIDGSGQAGDSLQEHEIFNFNAGGFTLAGEHTGLSETSFNTGTNRLTGSLTSAQTIVAPGATLNKAHGSVIVGDLDVHGTLDIGDSPGTSTVDGDVVFGASSILPIETLGDEHDVLIVTGSVTLDGELQIIHLGDVDVGTMQRTIIDGGSGLNGAHASVSGEGGLLISNSVDFDPSGFDLVLTTTVNSAWSVDGLADDELNVGNHLVDLIAQPSLDPELAGLINAVGAVPDAEDLRQILAELHPEGFDAGLRFLANSQGRFTSNIIDVPAHAVRRAGPGDAHVWASIDLSRFSSNDHRRHIGFDGDAYEFSAGVSGLGRGPVTVGFAGGYATFSGDTLAGLRDEFDVSLYRLAASARVAVGAAGANGYVDSVVSFAKGENELAMTVIDPVSDAQTAQSGTADISSVGFSTRFTMTGVNGRDWPVRPHAEIGIDSVRQDAVAISGGSGATALAVEKLDSARAYIALGAAFDRRLTKALSLNASAEGVRYFSDTENVIEARFLAAPEDVPAFRTVGANVEWQARLQAGASYEHASGLTLSADGFAEAGDVKTYGARLELSRRF